MARREPQLDLPTRGLSDRDAASASDSAADPLSLLLNGDTAWTALLQHAAVWFAVCASIFAFIRCAPIRANYRGAIAASAGAPPLPMQLLSASDKASLGKTIVCVLTEWVTGSAAAFALLTAKPGTLRLVYMTSPLIDWISMAQVGFMVFDLCLRLPVGGASQGVGRHRRGLLASGRGPVAHHVCGILTLVPTTAGQVLGMERALVTSLSVLDSVTHVRWLCRKLSFFGVVGDTSKAQVALWRGESATFSIRTALSMWLLFAFLADEDAQRALDSMIGVVQSRLVVGTYVAFVGVMTYWALGRLRDLARGRLPSLTPTPGVHTLRRRLLWPRPSSNVTGPGYVELVHDGSDEDSGVPSRDA